MLNCARRWAGKPRSLSVTSQGGAEPGISQLPGPDPTEHQIEPLG